MRRLLSYGVPAFLLLAACDGRREGGDGPGSAAKGSSRPETRHSRHRTDAPARKTAGLGEALAEVRARPASIERDSALAEIAWAAIESEPSVAREACSALTPDCPDRIRLVQHCAMRIAETDTEAALKWADGLGSKAEISAATCQIAVVLAESDPVAAARMLAENGVEGRERDVAVVAVLQRWAATGPEDAAAWAAAFPDGQVRGAGIRAILSHWLAKDAAAATLWHQSITDQSLKDEVTDILAELRAGGTDGITPP